MKGWLLIMVSIIIPIYKVEEYLYTCLDSVIRQTYSNLQIILVDDGSPDSCGKICEEYAMLDDRIQVIHKENGGLSDARNTGVRSANGDFVYFLDSDDYIEPHTIQMLLDEQKRTNADIIISNFYYTYLSHEDVAYTVYKERMIFDNYEAMHALVSGKLETFAWGKLIRTNIVKKYLFPRGKLFEDHYWTHYIVGDSEVVTYIPNPLVHYRQRNCSISYSYNLNRLDILDGWINRKEYLEKEYSDLVEVCMQQYAEKYVGIAWLILTRMKKEKKIGFCKLRSLNRKFHLQNYTSNRKKKLICALDKNDMLYVLYAIVYRIIGEK